jgi:hypothetical protein
VTTPHRAWPCHKWRHWLYQPDPDCGTVTNADLPPTDAKFGVFPTPSSVDGPYPRRLRVCVASATHMRSCRPGRSTDQVSWSGRTDPSPPSYPRRDGVRVDGVCISYPPGGSARAFLAKDVAWALVVRPPQSLGAAVFCWWWVTATGTGRGGGPPVICAAEPTEVASRARIDPPQSVARSSNQVGDGVGSESSTCAGVGTLPSRLVSGGVACGSVT